MIDLESGDNMSPPPNCRQNRQHQTELRRHRMQLMAAQQYPQPAPGTSGLAFAGPPGGQQVANGSVLSAAAAAAGVPGAPAAPPLPSPQMGPVSPSGSAGTSAVAFHRASGAAGGGPFPSMSICNQQNRPQQHPHQQHQHHRNSLGILSTATATATAAGPGSQPPSLHSMQHTLHNAPHHHHHNHQMDEPANAHHQGYFAEQHPQQHQQPQHPQQHHQQHPQHMPDRSRPGSAYANMQRHPAHHQQPDVVHTLSMQTHHPLYAAAPVATQPNSSPSLHSPAHLPSNQQFSPHSHQNQQSPTAAISAIRHPHNLMSRHANAAATAVNLAAVTLGGTTRSADGSESLAPAASPSSAGNVALHRAAAAHHRQQQQQQQQQQHQQQHELNARHQQYHQQQKQLGASQHNPLSAFSAAAAANMHQAHFKAAMAMNMVGTASSGPTLDGPMDSVAAPTPTGGSGMVLSPRSTSSRSSCDSAVHSLINNGAATDAVIAEAVSSTSLSSQQQQPNTTRPTSSHNVSSSLGVSGPITAQSAVAAATTRWDHCNLHIATTPASPGRPGSRRRTANARNSLPSSSPTAEMITRTTSQTTDDSEEIEEHVAERSSEEKGKRSPSRRRSSASSQHTKMGQQGVSAESKRRRIPRVSDLRNFVLPEPTPLPPEPVLATTKRGDNDEDDSDEGDISGPLSPQTSTQQSGTKMEVGGGGHNTWQTFDGVKPDAAVRTKEMGNHVRHQSTLWQQFPERSSLSEQMGRLSNEFDDDDEHENDDNGVDIIGRHNLDVGSKGLERENYAMQQFEGVSDRFLGARHGSLLSHPWIGAPQQHSGKKTETKQNETYTERARDENREESMNGANDNNGIGGTSPSLVDIDDETTKLEQIPPPSLALANLDSIRPADLRESSLKNTNGMFPASLLSGTDSGSELRNLVKSTLKKCGVSDSAASQISAAVGNGSGITAETTKETEEEKEEQNGQGRTKPESVQHLDSSKHHLGGLADEEQAELTKTKQKGASPVDILKRFVVLPSRINYPYANSKEKSQLSQLTGMPVRNIDVWLINYRQRKWKKVRGKSGKLGVPPPPLGSSPPKQKRGDFGDGKNSVAGTLMKDVKNKRATDRQEAPTNDKGNSREHRSPSFSKPLLHDTSRDEHEDENISGTTAEANWQEAVQASLDQFAWPEESRQTFRALEALVALFEQGSADLLWTGREKTVDIEFNHRAQKWSEFEHLISTLWSDNVISDDVVSSDSSNVKGKKARKSIGSAATMLRILKNKWFFQSPNQQRLARKPDQFGSRDWRLPLFVAAHTRKTNNIRNGSNKSSETFVALATVCGGGSMVRHLCGSWVKRDISERDGSENVLGGLAHLNDLTSANTTSGKRRTNQGGGDEMKGIFPDVESWAASLPYLCGKDASSSTSGDRHNGHFRPDLSDVAKWEDIWKTVLTRVPLGTFVSTLDFSRHHLTDHQNASVVGANEVVGAENKSSFATSSFERAAMLHPPEGFGAGNVVTLPSLGFMPLYFFRSNEGVTIPEPRSGCEDNAKRQIQTEENHENSPSLGKNSATNTQDPGTADSNLVSDHTAISDGKSQDQEKRDRVPHYTDLFRTSRSFCKDKEGVMYSTRVRRPPESAVLAAINSRLEQERKLKSNLVGNKLKWQTEQRKLEQESFSFLREIIRSFAFASERMVDKVDDTSRSGARRKKRKGQNSKIDASEAKDEKEVSESVYPHAPLGQIWRKFNKDSVDEKSDKSKSNDGSQSKSKGQKQNEPTQKKWFLATGETPGLDNGGTLLGRRWVWDEGYFTDGHEFMDLNLWRELKKKFKGRKGKRQNGLLVKELSLNLRSFSATIAQDRSECPHDRRVDGVDGPRAYCNCGFDGGRRSRDRYVAVGNNAAVPSQIGRTRRSERTGSSVNMSNVIAELASGKLNPHTLISCEGYAWGPDLRFLVSNDHSGQSYRGTYNLGNSDQDTTKKPFTLTSLLNSFCAENSIHSSVDDKWVSRVTSLLDAPRIDIPDPSQIQPFAVRVSPDAMFLTDLHAHLSESEIIGFLGGRYVASERCIYIQAAFPCKSTSRSDSGFTDVEMDPVSQIVAGDAIANHGMMVMGWYHSHPTFQPDPSVTDIENQGNYQRLFQNAYNARVESKSNKRRNAGESSDSQESEGPKLFGRNQTGRGVRRDSARERPSDEKTPNDNLETSDSNCPFVGLIVGTYDGRNPTAESVMRWFHVTEKTTGTENRSRNRSTTPVESDMSGDNVVGANSRPGHPSRNGGKETVNFPMRLDVMHRRYRRFNCQNSGDTSIKSEEIEEIRQVLMASGSTIRRDIDLFKFESALKECKEKGIRNFSSVPTETKPEKGAITMIQAPFCLEISEPFTKTRSSDKDAIANNKVNGTKEISKLHEDLEDASNTRTGTKPNRKGEDDDFGAKNKEGTNSEIKDRNLFEDGNSTLNEALCGGRKSDAFANALDIRGHTGNESRMGNYQRKRGSGTESLVIQLRMPPDSLSAFAYGAHLTRVTAVCSPRPNNNTNPHGFVDQRILHEISLPEIGCDETENITVSDFAAFAQNNPKINTAEDNIMSEPALPLFFTKKELSILSLNGSDGPTDEVRAGIIWNAVEREQLWVKDAEADKDSDSKISSPASSRSVLELLLLPMRRSNGTAGIVRDRSGPIENSLLQLADDDAAFVHTIDVVLSHYAGDTHAINPFESWNGAGEKGILPKNGTLASPEWNGIEPSSTWWGRYYAEMVLGGAGHGKMKRGHKICTCLIGWARHMQVGTRVRRRCHSEEISTAVRTEEAESSKDHNNFSGRSEESTVGVDDFIWDHESSDGDYPGRHFGETKEMDRFESRFPCRPSPFIDFVAEVMRLLAARWRETLDSKGGGRGRGVMSWSGRGRAAKRTIPGTVPPRGNARAVRFRGGRPTPPPAEADSQSSNRNARKRKR